MRLIKSIISLAILAALVVLFVKYGLPWIKTLG